MITTRKTTLWQSASRTSTIRKYRLGFATGILALCDDQLDTLDGSERIAELSDGVKNYLNRTETVEVNAINEEEKRDYNKSFDDRREEAIKAYKNSAEYSIIQQLQDEKLQSEIEKRENDLKDAESAKKKGDENEIASYKRHRNIFANKSMDDIIDDIKIRKAELIKNYQKQKMLKMIDDDNLDDEVKAILQGLLKDLDENKIYYNDQRIDAPKRKVPEIKQNIINNEDNNIIEIKPKSKKDLKQEEEQIKIAEAQLDRINQINGRDQWGRRQGDLDFGKELNASQENIIIPKNTNMDKIE